MIMDLHHRTGDGKALERIRTALMATENTKLAGMIIKSKMFYF